MSQIKKIMLLGMLLVIGAGLVAGCGSSNSQSPFDADAQKHSADWLPAGHMTAAQADIASCQECHGADLGGGISKASCTACHLGGPTDVHLVSFSGYTWLQGGHGRYVLANGTTACSNDFCHGFDLKGVTNSGPACNGTCHSFP